MNNNIYFKKLFKEAGVTAICCCLFFISFLMVSCDELDDTSVDINTDTNADDLLENETEESSAAEEEAATEEETSTEEEAAGENTEEEPGTGEIIINVYYSDQMAEYLVPESRIIPSENKHVESLYELMKKPIDDSLTSLVPGTTIINSVIIEEGNAKVDLSQEFLDDRYDSDTVDILLLYSIVNTLTQFSDVNSVTLYIDGEKLDILGQLDVSDPEFRRNDLIKDD